MSHSLRRVIVLTICIFVLALPLIGHAAPAAVHNYAFGSATASSLGAQGSTGAQFTGSGAWRTKVLPTNGKFEWYINPATAFGSTFTIDDILSITYHTNNVTVAPSNVDFYLTLYTVPCTANWYCHKLTGEPLYSNNYQAPSAGVWNTWTSDAGNNQLVWYDPIATGTYGFYNAPSLQAIQAGAIDWATYGHGSGVIDYGPESILYISFQTGSAWNNALDGYLDAITISLTNGETYNLDLEDGATDVWVDDNWAGTGAGVEVAPGKFFGYNAFAKIQDGVTAVGSGYTVNVAAGAYTEDVNLDKPFNLIGAGAGVTTVTGSKASGTDNATLHINASNVTIAGFTITREGNNTTDWNDPNLNTAGIAVQGTTYSGSLIRDNVITGNRTGIDINNSSGHTVRNNVITFNRTGLVLRNQTDNLTIVENDITNNWSVGFVFLDASGGSNSPVQTALNCTIRNNNISGNWYGQIVDRQTGGSLPAPGANLKNFSGNWLGTAAPWLSTANSAEPGYSAQIPVAYGGTATPPGGQPDVLGPASANFDFTPFLNSGTDTNVETTAGRGTNGFQGSFSNLWASVASAQTGSTGRIQEAIAAVSGSTVNLTPGAYAENVTIDKTLTLQGAGQGANPAVDSILEGTGLNGRGIFVQTGITGVTIQNLRVQNYTGANGTGIWADGQNNNFTVQNVTVYNNGVAGQSGGGVYMNGPVDGVLIDYVTAHNNKSRGIVIWNGFKTHITITNNDVQYNNCCGIELQDGTGSGVTMTGNTVKNNTDSGMSAIGLMAGAGPNLIANNTLDSNGRFGMEIKLPNGTGADSGDGSIVVQNNTVSLTTLPTDLRDYAGIAVFRRAYQVGMGYVDIPQGVVVRNNTVTGYRQTNAGSFSTGFGIVVEGNGMVVSGNTLNNNNVGVQVQAGHLPYTPNAAGDGDQSNVADQYFGRGNSPQACGAVTGNTYVGNGLDYRSVGVGASPYGYTVPAGASKVQQEQILNCASGQTVTYAGAPATGGASVYANGVTIDLGGFTVGPGSSAFTIYGDDVTLENGILDGAADPAPGVLVADGADNFIAQNMEIKNWGDGVEVQGAHESLKIVDNWIHLNTDAGLQVSPGASLAGVVTVSGNLFKANGVGVSSAVALNAEYNSWGTKAAPPAMTNVDADPWTFSEIYFDVDPTTAGDQYVRDVNETNSFDVTLMGDAENLNALSFKFTYDVAKITLNTTTFAGAWASKCTALPGQPAGTLAYWCNQGSATEWDGGAIVTFGFTANTQATGPGPWTALFDVAPAAADTSSAAIGGVKVWVNNAGFDAPSTALRDILDGDDGKITIHGLANYTGFVDLQGRANDIGAVFEVYNQQPKAGATLYASGTSASSGKYTTAYAGAWQLVIGQTYWFQVDRPLYLPTTAVASYAGSPIPSSWQHSKLLATRPLQTLTTVLLLGGDATNDNVIEAGDAGCIGSRYAIAPQACGAGGSSDVNGDGKMDILDLTLMGGNFGKTSSDTYPPTLWTP